MQASAPNLAAPARRSAGARRLWVAAPGVALLAALGFGGWWVTHPRTFSAGDGVGWHGPVGTTRAAAFGISWVADGASRRAVTIHGVRADVVENTAHAKFTFQVCTVDTAHGVGQIGAADPKDLSTYCSRLVPAKGATLLLPREPGATNLQQLVLTVTPTRPGDVRLSGVRLSYSQGWQRGSQDIGPTVRVHLAGSASAAG